MKKLRLAGVVAAFVLTGVGAQAGAPPACKTIHLANLGWTDNAVQNATFTNVVKALGYQVKSSLYSMEITYAGLKSGGIDVYLDNWMPAQKNIRAPYIKEKAIEVIGPDLTGAQYTLVVPAYLYKQGLTSFNDIHKFAGKLHNKIYGIEPGNDGNEHVLAMIKANKFDLGDFRLVQSSEAGMLSEIARKYKDKKPVVFLGWTPNRMNLMFKIKYLSGGSAYFGPHKGAALSFINTRVGYSKQCPNVGRLLQNFRLTADDENTMIYQVQVKHHKASAAAIAWLKAHPAWIKATLAGVRTVGGEPGTAAVIHSLQND